MTTRPIDTLPDSESDDARAFWAGHGIRKSYTQDQHWRGFMAERILATNPRRVIEFGCNVGRNLLAIRQRAPQVQIVGVDVNADAVAYGRKRWKLPLQIADERWLSSQPDDAFDVLFTVSVVDHLAEPDPMLADAARIARTLLLLEPWLGREGKVRTDVIRQTSPYSYSWNLPKRLKALGLSVEVQDYPLTTWGMGPEYRLYSAQRIDNRTA
jgi:SAM-dependent methyltransferase